MKEKSVYTSLYHTDKLYKHFGASDKEIKEFNSLLEAINKGNYVTEKEFEDGIVLIMEFIDKLDDENDFMFIAEYPEEDDEKDTMNPQTVLHVMMMVNFSAVLWMRKYNINITDSDDFGAIAFSNILSSAAFDNNVNSIIYLNEIAILPMFLQVVRILLKRAVIQGDNFIIHENAQNNLYAILHLLINQDTKSVCKIINNFSEYCKAIDFKQSESKDTFHGGEVFYYFDSKLANVIMENFIAINAEYEMEKNAYDVLADSIIEFIKKGKKIEDFKQAGLMILQKSKIEINDENLIVLHRKKGYDEQK